MNIVMKRKCMHCGLIHHPYENCATVREQNTADGREWCANPHCPVRHFPGEDCTQVLLSTIEELENLRDEIEKLTYWGDQWPSSQN